MNILIMPPRTFNAKLFKSESFKAAGTLDGFIDLATSAGTFTLALSEAKGLSDALNSAIADVENNCLYERDSLLERMNSND